MTHDILGAKKKIGSQENFLGAKENFMGAKKKWEQKKMGAKKQIWGKKNWEQKENGSSPTEFLEMSHWRQRCQRVTGGVFLRSRKPAPDPLSLTGVRTLSATNPDKSQSSRST
jgi:hypothetical protein